MSHPSAADLFEGKDLVSPGTLRGVYVDRRPEQVVRARFSYRAPNSYSWFSGDGTSGIVTDGVTHTVVMDGSAALIITEGEVSITHRFRNLLAGGRFNLDGWTLGDVQESEVCQRPAWTIEARPMMSGKQPMIASFDQTSGILLSTSGKDMFTGFKEIEFEPELDDSVFVWSGRIQENPIGVAYVVNGEQGVGVSWQIGLPGLAASYHRDLTFESKDEALSWASRHAVRWVESD
jgi:hypothetical protein